MKYLYKYPHAAYPYLDLIHENGHRTRQDCEYELLDTSVFDRDRYFDVFVEYAKSTPDDILIQITVCNRGPEAARIDVLPTLSFRNTWAWSPDGIPKPRLGNLTGNEGSSVLVASHPQLGEQYLYCDWKVPLLFTRRMKPTPSGSLTSPIRIRTLKMGSTNL